MPVSTRLRVFVQMDENLFHVGKCVPVHFLGVAQMFLQMNMKLGCMVCEVGRVEIKREVRQLQLEVSDSFDAAGIETQLKDVSSIDSIEGVFSGTLSYLFDRLRQGVGFDAALEDARERGYTEPDPRDDLSGADVARKLLILTRTAGHTLEPDDVAVESLVGLGETVEKRLEQASAAGQTLCYLARFDGKAARVGLEAVPAGHPAATVEGTDNLFAFTTSRYPSSPLVVRGSGAGPAVTAAGVFADILQACAEI